MSKIDLSEVSQLAERARTAGNRNLAILCDAVAVGRHAHIGGLLVSYEDARALVSAQIGTR